MGKTLGRFSIVLVAAVALLFGVSSAAADTTPDAPAAEAGAVTVPDAAAEPAEAADAAAADAAPDAATDARAKNGNKSGKKAAPGLTPAKIGLKLHGLKGGRLTVGNKFKVRGFLHPFAPGEKVSLIMRRGKKTMKRKTLRVKQKPGKKYGTFKFAKKLVKPGRYSVQVIKTPSDKLGGTKNSTRNFKIRYPDLDPGNRNSTVKIFNKLLKKQGYVNDGNKKYDAATGRAVLAFHKVNNKKRTENMNPGDFKKLADGRGGFKLRYPGAGKHVETDLSRQVMVLAKKGKVDEIYHISSGAPATPTIRGHFQFYRKEPGTNSLGMVNSVYFIRGYATHGYASVPDYPASHGCLRNPIPDSKHIYNWIDIGDDIYVYP